MVSPQKLVCRKQISFCGKKLKLCNIENISVGIKAIRLRRFVYAYAASWIVMDFLQHKSDEPKLAAYSFGKPLFFKLSISTIYRIITSI